MLQGGSPVSPPPVCTPRTLPVALTWGLSEAAPPSSAMAAKIDRGDGRGGQQDQEEPSQISPHRWRSFQAKREMKAGRAAERAVLRGSTQRQRQGPPPAGKKHLDKGTQRGSTGPDSFVHGCPHRWPSKAVSSPDPSPAPRSACSQHRQPLWMAALHSDSPVPPPGSAGTPPGTAQPRIHVGWSLVTVPNM